MKLQRKNKFLGLIGTGLLIASLATGGYVVFEEMQNKSHKLQGLYRKRAEFNTQL